MIYHLVYQQSKLTKSNNSPAIMSKTSKSGPRKRRKLEHWCTICNKTVFGRSYTFNTHLFNHNAIPARYSCDVCPKKFYRRSDFRDHMEKHKGVYSPRKYICDLCDRSFVLKNNLIIHLIRVHGEKLDSELGRFMCNVCSTGYSERRLLYKHIRRVHLNLQFSREPLHTQKLINETWIESVVSKQAKVSMTKVNNNVIVIKKLKCEVKASHCESSFVEYTPDGVDQYSKAICDHCGKEMCKKSLRTHIREVHMNIRRFKCNTCKNTFARRYQRDNHLCGYFRSKKKFRKNIVNNKNVEQPNNKTVIRKNKIKQTLEKNEVKLEHASKLSIVKKEF